ncbi:ATP-binding protein [Actinoplanes sp. DH11]|uniref:ATP-binding protein n=1 Tax=Actinoplanes sp. DH11 TaxID=2857011 RepID=UPI001E61FD4A|nr:ATP-binding protein [Actinoplanes sp. DH11]
MTALDQRAGAPASQPPYFVTTGFDRRGVSVAVIAHASSTVVEMKVYGRWSQQLGDQVTAGLRLCMAGPAEVVIVDLHDVGDLHGSSLSYWRAAQRAARHGPAPVHLALCVPRATMLDYRLRHHDGEPALLFATMADARFAMAARLAHEHRWQTRLPPHPASVRAARDLVARACHAWQLPHLHDAATLIVSELVTNAVEHAGTEFLITVFRRGGDLNLAVRDGDTRYPRLTEDAPRTRQTPLADRGRGLRLVHTAAFGWGAMPTRGGKVVWATVSGGTDDDACPRSAFRR